MAHQFVWYFTDLPEKVVGIIEDDLKDKFDTEMKDSLLYKNATIYSKPIAKIELGRLVLILKCEKNWCKISSDNYKGWVFKNYLWGKLK